MICPVTGKECNKPKVYHFTEATENEIRTIDLCEECADIYLNQANLPTEEQKGTKKLLSGFFKLMFQFMKQYQPGILGISNKSCSSCGTFLSDVQETGMLGCSDCYNHFGTELDYFFTQAQDGEHKTPEPKTNLQDALNAELQKAIEQENYEKAARIRDQLKSIK